MAQTSIIVAISENDVIGADGDLPWKLSADLKRFRRLTTGFPIIMGRKTYESIGIPLPGRHSIILTRQADYQPPGAQESEERVTVVSSLDDAFQAAEDAEQVFVIGGEAVFQLAIPRADRLLVTRVHARVDGDVYFPSDWLDAWTQVDGERFDADDKNDHAYSFLSYERQAQGGTDG